MTVTKPMKSVSEIIAAYKENRLSQSDVKKMLEQLQQFQNESSENTAAMADASSQRVTDRLAKPDSILLVDCDLAFSGPYQKSSQKRVITLPCLEQPMDSEKLSTDNNSVEASLVNYGEGIYGLKLSVENPSLSLVWNQSLIDLLKAGFSAVAENLDARVLLLQSEAINFLPVGENLQEQDFFLDEKILNLPLECAIPVIAVLSQDTQGMAWLLASVCDFMVCCDENHYGYGQEPTVTIASLLQQRFGYTQTVYEKTVKGNILGKDLVSSGLLMPVANPHQVESQALILAQQLAKAPRESLVLLKQHLVGDLLAYINTFSNESHEGFINRNIGAESLWTRYRLEQFQRGHTHLPPGPGTSIPINSNVVSLQAYDNGVVVITLNDKQSRNTFTTELIDGISAAFQTIESDSQHKVVVLTGFGNYFACGGTKESLLAIQSGAVKFTDIDIYSLPMKTSVPVIAAMQGHGIGAGWSMGMYSDVLIFSEKHSYISPYMTYGFTPGAGSTLVFPYKLGQDLGREILLTAHQYSGADLKARGLSQAVVPPDQVLPLAMTIAHHLATFTRDELVANKQQANQFLQHNLQRFLTQEQAMHQHCFVDNQEVLQRIQTHFNDGLQREDKTAMSGDNTEQQATTSQQVVMSDDAYIETIRQKLRETLADELLVTQNDLDDNMQFIDIGLDSITGVSWVRKLNNEFGLSINATKIYNHPTIIEFSKFIFQEGRKQDKFTNKANASLPESEDAAKGTTVTTAKSEPVSQNINADSIGKPLTVQSVQQITTPSQPLAGAAETLPGELDVSIPSAALSATPVVEAAQFDNGLSNKNLQEKAELPKIAVVGMAGQFPEASNLAEFWDNIIEGRNCISEVPETRWNTQHYFDSDPETPGKTYSKWMGILGDVDQFDPAFFNISPREAEWMDPQQRVFLQNAWHCIEDAGYNSERMSGSRCGVFVGCGQVDYGKLTRRRDFNSQNFMGKANAILAAKISYFLNLQGPCLSIDTACSSSLVAIAAACDSLALGSSDYALAGGVCVMATPDMHIMTSKSGMLSADGRCYTFDQRANGFVPGEGVGAIMLRRLADAERDGDNIQGVIAGWGVNQDGKTNGITAPNAESQAKLEKEIYEKHKINPETIQLIEAHGTGTKLGDPIEVEGLKEAFSAFTDKTNYCAIGSVKSNIGHLLTAAGIAGSIKLLLAMKYQKIPPTINYSNLNEHIELDDSPFFVCDETRDWRVTDGEKRRAAVSSLGFSGTNSHVVFEEYCNSQRLNSSAELALPVAVILSAKTINSLQAYAANLLSFLRDAENAQIAIGDLAYTLQVGRDVMDERFAVAASSLDELKTALQAFIDGNAKGSYWFSGKANANDEAIAIVSDSLDLQGDLSDWIKPEKLNKLLGLWVKGLAFDWVKLYEGQSQLPARISLPTYPFDLQRYWLDESELFDEFSATSASDLKSLAVEQLHPLLHKNTSTLFSEQRYSSEFSGEEFFFAHHLIKGRKVLPGVGHLEMVRAAVKEACGSEMDTRYLQIKNVVWMRPIVGPDKGDSELAEIHISLVMEDDGNIGYQIYSGDTDDDRVVHSQGVVIVGEAAPVVQAPTLDELQAQCDRDGMDANLYFAGMKEKGADLRLGFQGIDHFYLGKNNEGRSQVLTRITIPEGLSSSPEQFVLHPTPMDSAVHTFPPLFSETGEFDKTPLALPFALEELEVLGDSNTSMWALARHSAGSTPGGQISKYDIDLYNDNGEVCVRFKGFSVRTVEKVESVNETRANAATTDRLMVYPQWQVDNIAAQATAEPDLKRVVLICGQQLPATAEQQLANAEVVYLPKASKIGESTTDESVLELAKAALLHIQSMLLARVNTGVKDQVLVQVIANHPLASSLLGLLKTLQLENAKLIGQLIEIPDQYTATNIVETLNSNSHYPQHQHIRYLDGKRYLSRWQLLDSQQETASPWREQGVYLLTGGAGALGFIFAEEITRELKQATIIMTGRSTLSDEKAKRIDELATDSGITIEYRAVDITNTEAVKQLIADTTSQYGQLNGVLHSAGITQDNFIQKKTVAELENVMAPKVSGAVNLDQALKGIDLDFFVCFSSIASAIGNAGQADYAMANAFLDTFAEQRNRSVADGNHGDCGHTLSINWPLWQDGGMHIDEQTAQWMRDSTGMVPMSTSVGLQAFSEALVAGQSQVMVTEGNLAKMRSSFIDEREVIIERPNQEPVDVPVLDVVVDTVASSIESPVEAVQNALKPVAAKILKISAKDIDLDKELNTYGFDSITLTELTNKLNKEYQIPSSRALNPTLFFEHPTLRSFAQYLAEESQEIRAAFSKTETASDTRKKDAAEPSAVKSLRAKQPVSKRKPISSKTTGDVIPLPRTTTANEDVDIAVVGMSGRFPMANNIDEFWQNLVDGRDCISEVPADRWDWQAIYGDPSVEGNKTDIKWGGFMEDVDKFDPLFFGISPREALAMDPMQRLLMLHIWQAIEDAGYSAQSISGTKTSIIVGTSVSEYGKLLADAQVPFNAFMPTGRSSSLGANRMSYFLNFSGPSETVDTACSSSLVAIHRASISIRNGDCDMALVGGVNTLIAPDGHVCFRKAGMLCEDGRCKTFSKEANGYARGEGVGILFLKKLTDAQQAGDHIYGLIKGSGENHGGRANSLTAPNPKAQADLLKTVYTEAGIDPRTVSYIEAHGTGTELGDPVEVNGLKMAFRDLYKATGDTTVTDTHCGIGSAKSNIGHLELAAGAAGAIKVLLQLKHKTLAKSLHSEEVNPYIQLDGSPFRIIKQTQQWTALKDEQGNDIPRRAGVSSFGFGGANAHVVFEEYLEPMANQTQSAQEEEHVIVLSAKNSERLQARAEQLLEQIRDGKRITAGSVESRFTGNDLARIAYTLQVGREPMDERLGMLVDSLEDLQAKLEDFISGNDNDALLMGKVQRNDETLALFDDDEELQEAVEKWVARRKVHKLLSLWVKGHDFDWGLLHDEHSSRRMSLPVYPFARERFWPEIDPATIVPSNTVATHVITAASANESLEKQSYFMVKDWSPSQWQPAAGTALPTLSTPTDAAVIILTNQATITLAAQLATHLQNSQIVDLTDKEHFSSQCQQLAESDAQFAGCIDLVGCSHEADNSLDWIHWLQLMIDKPASPDKPMLLLCVTQGLEQFRQPSMNLTGASRVGLYRMLQSEYSKLRSRHMDTDAATDAAILAKQIAAEWHADCELSAVCYRDDQRFEPKLQPQALAPEYNQAAFPDDQVLWVTGGTRGIGLLCAQHFVKHYGVKKLVLTGREVIPPSSEWDAYLNNTSTAEPAVLKKIAALQELRQLGAEVEVLAVTLSDEKALKDSLHQVNETMGAVGGVLHCAGLNDWDNPAFIRKSVESIAQVMEPKVAGLDALINTFTDQPLEFFVLFSSVTAAIPSLGAGQSGYAIANVYMDYLAQSFQERYPLVSIQWPSWKESGMGEANTQAYKNTGLLSHTDAEGLAFLDQIIALRPASVVMPAHVNAAIWNPEQLMQRSLKNVISSNVSQQKPVTPVANTVNLSAQDPAALLEPTLDWLMSLFAKELMIDANTLDKEVPFADYGVDSIMLVQLLRRIDEKLNDDGENPIDPSIFYEYPTLGSFADWLVENHSERLASVLSITAEVPANAAQAEVTIAQTASDTTVHSVVEPQSAVVLPEPTAASKPVSQPVHTITQKTPTAVNEQSLDDIAVIGLSCQLPGAEDLEAYWQLLSEGHSAIAPVPESRWGYSTNYYAGLIDNITHFDPSYFLIADNDAVAMDPQALLLLEESLKTLCHAGYSKAAIKGTATGVFIGARTTHRPEQSELNEATNPIIAVGQNYLAANISQFFDLQGPSLVSDTACSSALVNMNMAIQHLRAGDISAALVGGISLLQTDAGHRLFEQRNLLTKHAEFHIFDQRASGVILGEGVGMVMLKKLEQALADGDQIHAVVKGLAINNDGRTAGPATPNLQAQKAVMENALQRSGYQASDIDYIELNGSGSEVTDLLELKAVEAVYRSDKSVDIQPSCELGSMEPNIGHPLCAKGIASFIKVVLMLSKGQRVPFLSGQQPMTHYDIERSPFYFRRQISADGDQPTRAAINCFADGGTNAHVVLEAWQDDSPRDICHLSLPVPELQRREIFSVEKTVNSTPVSASTNQQAWDFDLTKEPAQITLTIDHPILRNHIAYGQELLPGLAYIDVLYQFFTKQGYDFKELELRNLSIYAPLVVSEDYHVVLAIKSTQKQEGIWQLQLEGQEVDSKGMSQGTKRYAVAEMHCVEPTQFSDSIDINNVSTDADIAIELASLYEQCSLQSLNHTGFIKGEGQVYENTSATHIDIALGGDALPSFDSYMFHPTLIDGTSVGAQRLFASLFEGETRLILPLFYESFRASGLLQKQCVSRIQNTSLRRKNELIYMNLEFFDAAGNKVAELNNYACKIVRDEGAINPNKKAESTAKAPAQQQARQASEVRDDSAALMVEATDDEATVIAAQDYLVKLMADQTGTPVDDIDTELGYYELGLDSAKLLDMVGALEGKIGDSLAPTLLFEYTTIEELSHYLAETYASVWQATELKAEELKVAEPNPVVESSQNDNLADTSTGAAEAFLVELMAEHTGTAVDDIDTQLGYYELGLDSAKLLDMVGALEKKLDDSLAPTLLFEYTTIEELADYLADQYPQHWAVSDSHKTHKAVASTPITADIVLEKTPDSVSAKPHSKREADEDVAVIGMAGRYPGANNLETFWTNLKEGKDSITEVPQSRWDEHFFDGVNSPSGKAMSKWGGFIEDPDCFDAQFFRISPWEAKLIDPQQRLFLEVCWETMEDAGYTPQNLVQPRGRNQRNDVGVFVGVMHNDYAMLAADVVASGERIPVSLNYAQIANRVSFFCNFHGPSMTIDTVCSSSLIAVHLALESIQRGECDVALAGGVNLSVHPNKYMTYGLMDMHSSDGRCRAFGADGDGYVSGEGIGAVLLKPLALAERDNDHIYALVKGSTTNHVGAVSGLTVPSPVAQADMIETCIEKTGVDPRTISYLEAHGTGTSLGDPIEIQGLVRAFSHYTKDKQYCAIGSVKSNIGHAESAAGISGLHKLILQMHHKTLVPSLHSDTLNPYLDFANSPFYVQHQLEPWVQPTIVQDSKEKTYPRRGALSSFGASGSNAHVILEEYLPAISSHEQPSTEQNPVVIVLSAKKQERLVAYAEKLLAYCKSPLSTVALADMAYTLQVGRLAMEERLAFSVNSLDELREKLQAFVDGRGDESWQAKVKKKKKSAKANQLSEQDLAAWIDNRDFDAIAQKWLQGIDVDWSLVYRLSHPERQPQRVALPAYPFAKERHWLDAPKQPNKLAAANEPSVTDQSLSVAPANSATSMEEKPQATEMVYFTPRWQARPLDTEVQAKSIKTTVFVASDDHSVIANIEKLPFVDTVFPLPVVNDLAKQVYTQAVTVFNYVKNPQLIKASQPELLLVYVPYKGSDFPYRSLAGALRTVALELPFIKPRLVFDEALAQNAFSLIENNLRDEILYHDHFSEVIYQHNQRQVLANTEVELEPVQADMPLIRHNGVYLITGGLGGLGRLFAEQIGSGTGARLILTGRSLLTEKKKQQIAELTDKGLSVEYFACDTANLSDVQKVINHVTTEYGGLHGVIHSAGAIKDNFIPKKTADEIKTVFTAKVDAIINLDTATKDIELDFFVCFSSAASQGNPGQFDYAAANAFLDAFASHRQQLVNQQQRQGKSVSINWPLWKEGGMSVDSTYEKFMFDKYGVVPLETKHGIDAFSHALSSSEPQLGVMQGNREKIQGLLAGIQPTTVKPKESTATKAISADQRDKVEVVVIEAIAEALGMDTADVDQQTEFVDYGMDSISATKIANHINQSLGLDYTGAIFLELDTGEKLIQHLLEHDVAQAMPEASEEPSEKNTQTVTESSANVSSESAVDASVTVPEIAAADTNGGGPIVAQKPIAPRSNRVAIIGYDARLPGARSVEQYWSNIGQQQTAIRNISAAEWEARGVDLNAGGNNFYNSMQYGALIDDIDLFDADFWGIDNDAAQEMDPQQRLLMQSIWHCCEHAGYSMSAMTKNKVGLFLAIDSLDYRSALRAQERDFGIGSGISVGMIANQISYHCNFRGPSEVIDNACASTYVALKRAAQAIELGECDTAIVGGAKILLDPLEFMGRDQGEILSQSGSMYPFDARADGYIRGEGVGCILLKAADKANADNDKVHAIVAGVGVSHNGSNSLSQAAPNVDGQYQAIKEAYQAAGISPVSVNYIEAHGTANNFSDAAEVAAFKQYFKEALDPETYKQHRCALSTVKGNTGHLEGASGIASLIKALCALEHKQIAPIASLSGVHPSILLDRSPFFFPTELIPWDRAKVLDANGQVNGAVGPRRVGLHSIGIGGVNAHVILEEPTVSPSFIKQSATAPMLESDEGYHLFTLSARSEAALETYLKHWHSFLKDRSSNENTDLHNLAYSSQVARDSMPYRVAIVANSQKDLLNALASGLTGISQQAPSLFSASNCDSPVTKEIASTMEIDCSHSLQGLQRLAQAWLRGETVDWKTLAKDRHCQTTAIPTYPFEAKKAWFSQHKESADPFADLFYETFAVEQGQTTAVTD